MSQPATLRSIGWQRWEHRVVWPATWRTAETGDAETVVRWLNEFFIEAFGEP